MLTRDLRLAFRALRKTPGFTAVAVLTLAIGIGATTTAFTQLNAVFLTPLDVRDPQELRSLSHRDPRSRNPRPGLSIAIDDYRHVRDEARTLSSVACWQVWSAQPLGERGPIHVQFVTANYFATLGVSPILGRAFTPDDDRAGSAPVAMLSHAAWQREFGAEPTALGRILRIQGTPFTIVGVLPRGFFGLDPTSAHDVFVPFALAQLVRPGTRFCQPVVRLTARVTTGQAQAEVQTLYRASPAAPPNQSRETVQVTLSTIEAGGGPAGLRERTAPSLGVLMGATSLVLLAACANLAGLLLVRATTRAREIGTQLALGATRGRIVRQQLTESLVLAVTGGVLGVLLAYVLTPLLPSFIAELGGVATLTGEPGPLGLDVIPDWRVLAFSLVVTMATTLLFGAAPALHATRIDVMTMLKHALPTSRTRGWLPGGAAFAGIQVALAMVLLVGGGLFVQTSVNLGAVPLGYRAEQLLFATLNPVERPRAFIDDAMRRMEVLPGVASVAASQWPLFNDAEPKLPVCLGNQDGEAPALDVEWVTPGFFETWGVEFLAGRDFTPGAPGQAVVNRAFATRMFPNRPAVGETVGFGACPGRPMTIVGVVADHRDRPRIDVTPMVYVPYPGMQAFNPTTIALRVRGDARQFVGPVRQVIAGLENSLTDGDVTTGVAYRDARIRRERTLTWLLTAFASLALALACLGIYGMVAYVVTRRTRELGIRTALGATRRHIVEAVTAPYGAAVAAGVVTGGIAAVVLSVFVDAMLFGVSGVDARTLARGRGGQPCRRSPGRHPADGARHRDRSRGRAAARMTAGAELDGEISSIPEPDRRPSRSAPNAASRQRAVSVRLW